AALHSVEHVEPRRTRIDVSLVLSLEVVKPISHLTKEAEVVSQHEELAGVLHPLPNEAEREVECVRVQARYWIIEHHDSLLEVETPIAEGFQEVQEGECRSLALAQRFSRNAVSQ